MKTIRGFTQQHQELLSIVSKLSERLSEKEVASDPKGARSLLSQLAGKLTIHLAMEDQHLYPFLMNHPRQELKELSQRFSQEMGGILSALKPINQDGQRIWKLLRAQMISYGKHVIYSR